MQSVPSCSRKSLTWNKKDLYFIKTIQGYELNNDLGTKGSKGVKAWREISIKSNLPELYCRKKWNSIKYNYLLLKIMIHIGRVTENMVRENLKTAKYLDGNLDFLNKYVLAIPNSEIPLTAHRFFESEFGSSAQTRVDVEKLIKIEDKSAVVIKDYKQEKGIEPTSILPNIENYDSITNTQEIVVSLGTDEEVGEVYEIQEDEDLIDTEFEGRDALPKIQMNYNENEDPMCNVETNVTGSNGGRLRELLMSTENEKTSGNEMDSAIFARFLVKYKNSSIETEEDCDLKEYMNNVAELVCNRLPPRKRKYFLSQVDLIVSDLLEGDNIIT